MKALIASLATCAVLCGCGTKPAAVPVAAPAPQRQGLSEGDQAIVWDVDKTTTSVIVRVGRGMETANVGERVVYLGKFPARNQREGEQARIRLLEGEAKGAVGFVELANLKPIPPSER